MWHQAPLPYRIYGHSCVANRQEGMILAIGGRCDSSGGQPGAWVRNHVLLYDVAGGSWQVNPSGCTYPGEGELTAGCTAAVAVDDYTIMVLGALNAGTSARNDLLDLRTWRWRSGSGLTNDHTNCIGLTMFEGQAIAVGGIRDLPAATCKVRAYDVQRDVWTELAQLPQTVGVHGACPVAMRVANALA
jgi:hypothetical protein